MVWPFSIFSCSFYIFKRIRIVKYSSWIQVIDTWVVDISFWFNCMFLDLDCQLFNLMKIFLYIWFPNNLVEAIRTCVYVIENWVVVNFISVNDNDDLIISLPSNCWQLFYTYFFFWFVIPNSINPNPKMNAQWNMWLWQ